jgi:hypothetical protein
MPRQSDSAENNPGEKAMMRKLAVTAFALSLAALGCGSDSGTKPTPDTGVALDGAKTDVVSQDVGQTPDVVPAGPEVQVALDGPSADVPLVLDSPVLLDQAQVLDQAPQIVVDAPKQVDTQAIDGPKPVLDGGVETPRVDSGAVDSGSVDGGSAG